jgi:hypothetical protein
MDDHRQWVAYRGAPGAMLRAPLPSAPEVGVGWRGVATRRWLPLDQLDDLVLDTVSKLDAAIGVARAGSDWGYVIAVARHGDPVRLVVGIDPSRADAPEGLHEVLARCGVTGSGKRWRTGATRAFAEWSRLAPRGAARAEVAAVLASHAGPADALEALLDQVAISLPAGSIPDVGDLHTVARERIQETGTVGERRRWFARR